MNNFWSGFEKRAGIMEKHGRDYKAFIDKLKDDLKHSSEALTALAKIEKHTLQGDFYDAYHAGLKSPVEFLKKVQGKLDTFSAGLKTHMPGLYKADKFLRTVKGIGGTIGGLQLGAAPGFLLRSRFEDKFKDKRDWTAKDTLLHYSPHIGAVAGGLIMGAKGFKSGFLPTLPKLASIKDTVQLKPHQEHFIGKLIENDGSLLAAHATGTGKTLTGIAGFERLKLLGKAGKSIVVVPASLRENFVDNLKKYTNSSYSVYGPKGEKASKDVSEKSNSDYNIISYDLFREHGDKILENTKADTLILDEIHRARGTEGSTYNELKDLRSKVRNAITLTGSIVNNEPNDVVPLLDITHTPTGHKFVSKSFFDKLFVQKNAVTKGFFKPKVYVEKSIKNKTQLGDYLRGKVHFVSHEALDKDLPKRVLHEENVVMTPEQSTLYNFSLSSVDPLTRWKIRNNIPVSQREAKDAFSQLMQARQVSTDPSILDKRFEGKDPYDYSPKVKKVVDDLVSHLDENSSNKSVIFGNLIKGQVGAVEEALKRRNIPYSRFLGMGQEGMTSKKRPKELEDFKEGKKKVLLISGAGAEGIDLKNTTMLQMLEGHYNPERIQQAESRVRRLGSFAHLPEEDRKVIIKRYTASPMPSKFEKVYGALGMTSSNSGVDKWIYTIADKKDKLNKVFREALDKAPLTKTAGMFGFPGEMTPEDFATSNAAATVMRRGESAHSETLGSSYAMSMLKNLFSIPGAIPAKIIEKRREADVEKNLKQRLLDMGKETLINKRHYPKILAESKIDERMIDAGIGLGGLAGLAGIGSMASPKLRSAVIKPASMLLKGLEKFPIIPAGMQRGLRQANAAPAAHDLLSSALTGAAIGLTLPSMIEYAKTKTMQAALAGRHGDLAKGIQIYEDKLRKKMERKYKSSKGYVNEFETKKELGIDII